MVGRIKTQERSWERAQRSKGELGWRPSFRERVIAALVGSGNLGEEVDV